MDIDPRTGLPIEQKVFEELAKGQQQINVSTTPRRYGKLITLVTGFDKNINLKDVAKTLKEKLACGGTVKNDAIELQGNHLKQVKPILIEMGFPEDSVRD